MRITQQLHDTLIELGFEIIDPRGRSTNEPDFLIISKEDDALSKKYVMRLPNHSEATLAMVLTLLIADVHEAAFEDGVTYGKREVGKILKQLIEQ
jgi:hypothetical protein